MNRKIVRERQKPTPEERGRLMCLWTETSHRQLEVPQEELFAVQHVQNEVPAYAPIFACASAEHGQLDRAGISTASWGVGLTV